jgi:Na+-driven multidrug efflux pump
MSETVGLLACLWPEVWLGLFGHDPAMLAAGAQYLHIVGPFYGMFGLGLALYFASQGVGKLLWAVVAGVLRLTVAVAGGQLAVNMGFGLGGVFAALSAALVVFGLVNTAAFAGGGWFRRV